MGLYASEKFGTSVTHLIEIVVGISGQFSLSAASDLVIDGGSSNRKSDSNRLVADDAELPWECERARPARSDMLNLCAIIAAVSVSCVPE
jgi:hypothetical protein